jgi:hypothetical protein
MTHSNTVIIYCFNKIGIKKRFKKKTLKIQFELTQGTSSF